MSRRKPSSPKTRRGARPTPAPEPAALERSTSPPVADEGETADPFDDFCALLCRLRREKDLTQEELGSILHVSQKTIHRWEDGLRPPPLVARGILVAIDEYAPQFVPAVSDALEIPYPVPHPVPHRPDAAPDGQPIAPPPSPAIVQAAFEGALFEASERLGASSARVRDAIVLVLERMTLLQLDAGAAARIARAKG